MQTSLAQAFRKTGAQSLAGPSGQQGNASAEIQDGTPFISCSASPSFVMFCLSQMSPCMLSACQKPLSPRHSSEALPCRQPGLPCLTGGSRVSAAHCLHFTVSLFSFWRQMRLKCANPWNSAVANFMASLAPSKKKPKKTTTTNKQLPLMEQSKERMLSNTTLACAFVSVSTASSSS